MLQLGRQTFAVADEGTGAAAAATLTPANSYIEQDCQDVAGGCTITMGEGSAEEGDVVVIVDIVNGTDAGPVGVSTYADTATVSELAGAFAMDDFDTLTLAYTGGRWVEVSRSNN